MCETCGCNDHKEGFIISKPHQHADFPQDHHIHSHDHNHPHEHDHLHAESGRLIEVEKDALYKNNLTAERNRGFFEAKNILTINFVSSPGSGKTTILEKIITDKRFKNLIAVIEGDQQTTRDADRIHAAGVPVIQVNTGSGCHLDAGMINSAMKELNLQDNSILMIENVGNLVCPAMFDLGEKFRIVIISVTEGEDKPLKYPYMFQSSHVCLINKTDLLPHLDFNMNELKNNAIKINHHLEFFELSAKTGEGFDEWLNWLKQKMQYTSIM